MKPINTIKTIKVNSPFTGPTKTRTYKYNGKMITDHHYGIDLTGGSEIVATADGQVIKVVNSGTKGGTMCQVRIQHKDYQSAYYHLKSGSIVVKKGQWIKAGTKIGIMGDTGKSTNVHLHFQIDKGSNATAIDPYDYVFNGKELKPLENPTPAPSKLPAKYKVVKGDTMSKICKKFYGQYTTKLGSKIVATNKAKYPKISLSFIVVGWTLTIPA